MIFCEIVCDELYYFGVALQKTVLSFREISLDASRIGGGVYAGAW
jgi:hypothetical protein